MRTFGKCKIGVVADRQRELNLSLLICGPKHHPNQWGDLAMPRTPSKSYPVANSRFLAEVEDAYVAVEVDIDSAHSDERTCHEILHKHVAPVAVQVDSQGALPTSLSSE